MTILIIEDHDAVRNALHDWLKFAFPQSRVVAAVSGEEAVYLTREESPQLVLLDIDLSTLNGFELTKKIKAAFPSTQVVILTIQEDNMYRAIAEAAGASAYVPKRTMLDTLKPTISQLLSNNSKDHL
jgi:DNA-binding NarL/FixJ family response regulator